MKDTSPDVDAAFTALFAARSASERVRMTCAMFDDAKALMASDIRSKHPDISPADLRILMFDRLYFGDFDAATRDRIVSALRSRPVRLMSSHPVPPGNLVPGPIEG
jgi:hypothetical protein